LRGFWRLKLLKVERMEVTTAEKLITAPRSPLSLVERPAAQRLEASLRIIEEPPKTRPPLRVLLVEDDPADVELVLLALRNDGFQVASDMVQSVEDFTQRIRTGTYDVILADYNLPQWRGMDTLEILRKEQLDVPLIVVTGYLGEEKAVDCIKQGATDCVLKNNLGRLPLSVRRALEERQLRQERRRSEEELARKVEELARSNQDLEQFAYVASHDLQEPLRMVANYTQLLAERYRGRLDEQADKYIRYAVDGAVRMQALIQDLLKFSRVGKKEIDLRPTDLRAVVEQAQKNLEAAVQESHAAIHWNGLPVVMGDASQLALVFQNLIANGIKFHGEEKPEIQIDAEKKNQEWLLTVSDNGIGIPQENWQDVFVIFRRLHTRTEYDGNGIGLSICKKIIERHGGKIWIEAQAKPGCCFKFTLPGEPAKPSQEGRV
jgi:signal transduction histidine kinase